MQPNQQPHDAGRRIKWLAFATASFAVLFSVAWFTVAHLIDNFVDEKVGAAQADGHTFTCANQTVRGYPFRFGLFCSSTEFIQRNNALAMQAGALRSAAQFYDPFRVIVELDGPMVVETPAHAGRLEWQSARSSLHATRSLPRQVNTNLTEPVLFIDNERVAAADAASFHLRTPSRPTQEGSNAGDLDLAARIQSLTAIGERQVPQPLSGLGLDIDVVLYGGAERMREGWNSLRDLAGMQGTLRRIGIVLTEDRGVLISGPFSIDMAGQLNGRFDVRIVDLDGIRNAVLSADGFADELVPMMSLLPTTPSNGDEATIKLTIDKGTILLGFIPVFRLPSLF